MNWIVLQVFNEDITTTRLISDNTGTKVYTTEEEALAVAEQFDQAYVVLIEQ